MHNIPRKPVLLIILDGFGYSQNHENNAIAKAHTPHLDAYFSHWPNTLIQTSGKSVGLPEGQMGNSEVGHLTLGCGSIIRQDLVRLNDAIASGEFFNNVALLSAIKKAKTAQRPLHLLGLVSDGGVHSHINHLLALIDLCARYAVKPVLHMICDGRDTAPQSALKYVAQVEPALQKANGFIATIMGRYYGMDRDQRWDRTEKSWRLLIVGKGIEKANSATEAVENSYANKIDDEFIVPTSLPQHQHLTAEDQIVFFNFRKDRPRQLSAALSVKNFDGFDRGDFPLPTTTCLMPYDQRHNLPYAYSPEKPAVTLAEIISEHDIKQFHCAETEKYAHVTYFFNGGHEKLFPGEKHQLIPSPAVATYDQKPEMSASEVTDAVTAAILSNEYGFIVVNYANGDMIGHTAKLEAAIQAVETLDEQVGRLLSTAQAADYSVILTADHGNCEEMLDTTTGAPHTQHTTNPVPCLLIDEERWQLTDNGGLANIAPTVLQLMGIQQPANMTAESLLIKSLGKAENHYQLNGAA